MRTVVGRAPVRIDLAGGTIDLWPIPHTLPEATTVNVALDLPAVVRVEPLVGAGGAGGAVKGEVEVESLDAKVRARVASAAADPATVDPSVRLLLRAVAAIAPEGGVAVRASTTSPQGAGLGGSSALLACAMATLGHAVGRPRPLEEVRRLAQDVETAMLRAPTGYQDYYPPLFGGCLALTGRIGGVTVEPLRVDLAALTRRLRLVYTGVPHHSGITNWGVMRAYFDGEARTVDALAEIADVSARVARALRAGDLDGALALVVAEGAIRVRMAPGVSTPGIAALDAAVRAAGALGTKVCGAGGGGCVLVVLRDDREPPGLASALTSAGGRAIDVRLVPEGFTVTEGGAR